MATTIEVRRFDAADDRLDMKQAGGIDIIKMADGTTGMHAVFRTGWTWEKDEKPLLGCRHLAPCITPATASLAILSFEWSRPNVETVIASGDLFRHPAGS